MTRRLLVIFALALGITSLSACLTTNYEPMPDPRCWPKDCPVDPNAN